MKSPFKGQSAALSTFMLTTDNHPASLTPASANLTFRTVPVVDRYQHSLLNTMNLNLNMNPMKSTHFFFLLMVIAISLFSVSTLQAQTGWPLEKIYDDVTWLDNATTMEAADLDNDGDLDVVIANGGLGEAVFLYENLGGGEFASAIEIGEVFYYVRGITFGDLDDNGLMDIIVTNNAYPVYFRNLGGLAFETNNLNSTISFEEEAICIDIDDDGDLDVLRGKRSAGEINWLQNLGGGVFAADSAFIDMGDDILDLIGMDFDGDGDEDILISSAGTPRMSWLENLGGGSWSSPQLFTTSSTPYAYEMVVVDLDNDGDNDIAVVEDYEVTWYENLGGLSFSARTIISTDISIGTGIDAADFDGDGDMDLVSSSDFDDKIAWYENSGIGTFTTRVVTITARGALNVIADDFTGDGNPDLAVLAPDDYSALLYRSIGGGAVADPTLISRARLRYPAEVFVADIDNDGDNEVLFSGDDRYGAIAENLGDGTFGEADPIDNFYQVKSTIAFDKDGDGDMEVVFGGSQIDIFENVGDLNFGPKIYVDDPGSSVYELVAGDLDGDGDMDLVGADYFNEDVFWYENTGGMNFGPKQIIDATAEYCYIIHLVDINLDGDLDILFNDRTTYAIYWRENLGGGTFGARQLVVNNFTGLSSIEPADIDGDGDMDIFISDRADDELSYTLNLGPGLGIFGVVNPISDGSLEPTYIAAADYDLDGDQDVAATFTDTYYDESKVVYYENLGGGSFGAPIDLTEDFDDANDLRLIASDVDGDGDKDIITAGDYDNIVVWLENIVGPGCSPSYVPENLQSNYVPASGLTLSWTPVLGSLGCQLLGTRISPPGPSASSYIFGADLGSKFLPASELQLGTTWSWKIRCACETSPAIVATPFSQEDTFSLPALSVQNPLANSLSEAKLEVFPNPAIDHFSVVLPDGVDEVAVHDVNGKLMQTISINEGLQSIVLECENWSRGTYLLTARMEDSITVRKKITLY